MKTVILNFSFKTCVLNFMLVSFLSLNGFTLRAQSPEWAKDIVASSLPPDSGNVNSTPSKAMEYNGATISEASVSNFTMNCNPAGATIVNNQHISSMLTSPFSGVVCIKGVVTIDIDFEFAGATIFMADSAKIVVDSNVTLSVANNSLIQACNGMWESIVVNAYGSLLLKDSKIKNGYKSIYVNNMASALVSGCEFTDNFVSIYVSNGKPEAIEIYGNKFNATGNFDSGNYNTIYDKPYAGIIMSNVADVTQLGSALYSPNKFEFLYYGIKAINSSITVVNCLFKDLVENNAIADAPGIGVYSISEIYGKELKILGSCVVDEQLQYPNGFSARYNFYEVDKAIVAHGVHTDIRNNCLVLVKDGIEISRAQDMTSLIRDNEMLLVRRGIFLHNNAPMESINIQDNVISVGYWHFNPELEGLGEFVLAEIENAVEHHSTANYINNTSRYIATYGYKMIHSGGWKFENNYLSWWDFIAPVTTPVAGVFLMNNDSMYFACNNFNGPMEANNGMYGYKIFSSRKTELHCNTTNYQSTGIKFEEDCVGSILKGHIFGDHEIGLHLSADAVIGHQAFHGNLWLGVYTILGALHENPDPAVLEKSKFMIHVPFGELVPPSFYPADFWIIPNQQGSDYECDLCGLGKPENNPVNSKETIRRNADSAATEVRTAVLPNPSLGTFFIRANTDAAIQIYDLYGRLVLSENIFNYQDKQISGWPKGIYVLRVLFEDGTHEQHKIIVSH